MINLLKIPDILEGGCCRIYEANSRGN